MFHICAANTITIIIHLNPLSMACDSINYCPYSSQVAIHFVFLMLDSIAVAKQVAPSGQPLLVIRQLPWVWLIGLSDSCILPLLGKCSITHSTFWWLSNVLVRPPYFEVCIPNRAYGCPNEVHPYLRPLFFQIGRETSSLYFLMRIHIEWM